MEPLKIILLCIFAAVTYGVLHDQVTARVCVEYFTIGHPPMFSTDSPTLLAFGWGVVATWWMGLILSVPAVLASRLGSWPKQDARHLLRPIAVLLFVMGCASLGAGIAGYLFNRDTLSLWMATDLGTLIPREKQALFLADAAAHLAAYGVGFFGGLILCGWVVVRRWRLEKEELRRAPS